MMLPRDAGSGMDRLPPCCPKAGAIASSATYGQQRTGPAALQTKGAAPAGQPLSPKAWEP